LNIYQNSVYVKQETKRQIKDARKKPKNLLPQMHTPACRQAGIYTDKEQRIISALKLEFVCNFGYLNLNIILDFDIRI
jgi:hypothetical protein